MSGVEGNDHARSVGAALEDQRGHYFASFIDLVVGAYGPSDLSGSERRALADHMTNAAVEWVKARNVAIREDRS